MKNSFFNPNKIEISDNLILIPFFPDGKVLKFVEESAVRQRKILSSYLFSYPDYDVLYGFLGYSNLLTIIEFIQNVRKKNVFFLGTAGSLKKTGNYPELLSVSEIYPEGIFKYFTNEESLSLTKIDSAFVKNVTGISIDIIQRENSEWYENVKSHNFGIVEMEIFPLRWYLGVEFTAFVVTSDIVSDSGILYFNRKSVKEKMFQGYKKILEMIK